MAGNATLEELALEPAAAPDLTKILLSGDDVPEVLRGRSAADLLAWAKSRDEALRISEQARDDARRMTDIATRAAPVAAPPVPIAATPKDLTEEELKELVSTNPAEAIRLAMEQTRRKTTEDFNARLGPLVSSAASSVEAQARVKYSADFAVLEPEIKEFIERIPVANRAAALGSMEAWDALISYQRGQHIDKVVDARLEAAITKRLGNARNGQQAAAPTNLSGGTQASVPTSDGGVVWDAYTIDILDKTFGGDTPENRLEYTKWKNKGRILT